MSRPFRGTPMTPPLARVAVILALFLPCAARAADEKKGQEKDKDAEKNPVIKVDDRLEVTVFDLQGPGVKTVVKQTVDKKGEIKLPYVDRVAAKGLTCGKLEAAIVKAYRDANLIANATVSVEFAKEKKEYEGL